MRVEDIVSIFGVEDQLGNKIIEIPDADRTDFASWLAAFGYTKGVEVGTEQGLYAETLCKANPLLELICVDPYQSYPDYLEHISQSKLDRFLEIAKERLAPYNARILRDFSADAADRFPDESLDFVYLDGNHDLEYIMQDLELWTPKIKNGGLVSGHDYAKRGSATQRQYRCMVIEALNTFCDKYNISPLFLIGTKEMIPGQKRERSRSWFFVVESGNDG